MLRGAQRRHRDVTWFVEEVLQLPAEQQPATTDAIWALINVQNYRLLVLERGWPGERYEAWLARMLGAVVDDQASWCS